MKPLAIDLFCGAEPLRLLDMFSGIGGFSLGFQNAGFARPVAFVEIDPFCQRVLAKHWPSVPGHDDVKTREFIEGEADVIAGGFPCQDVSCAGKRAGIPGARSGLYRELVRALRLHRFLQVAASCSRFRALRVLPILARRGSR